ncbi:gluconokinase [Acidipila sp. EB88]|uniref:gluconokinase n=1 Tax=Acidipila sp. EB88 TaxID=2305226 RepID=UPI000F5EAAAF|nr:gluconokinase [Acidipila sp. EB88]RRA47236.1 gluconokinase [Acidipila sp. EB88]
MIVILMGVTGTGKSTVGLALRKLTGWEFAEGDDFHSEANKNKMRAGVPLTDGDRAPWLASLHAVLAGWVAAGKSGIMTCSALKQSYRDTLVEGFAPGTVRFALLEAPKQLLEQRLEHRPGHFMNPALLDSQLATLEVPEDALHVSAASTAAASAAEIAQRLGVVPAPTPEK